MSDFIMSPILLLTGKPKCCTPSSQQLSIQTLISGGDSRYSWVFICALGPRRGGEMTLHVDRNAVVEGVHARHQYLARNNGSAALVKEYKQLVLAQTLLKPLKT